MALCSRALQEDEPKLSFEEALRRLEEQEASEAVVDTEPIMSLDEALRRSMEQVPGPVQHQLDSDADSDEYQSDMVIAHAMSRYNRVL